MYTRADTCLIAILLLSLSGGCKRATKDSGSVETQGEDRRLGVDNVDDHPLRYPGTPANCKLPDRAPRTYAPRLSEAERRAKLDALRKRATVEPFRCPDGHTLKVVRDAGGPPPDPTMNTYEWSTDLESVFAQSCLDRDGNGFYRALTDRDGALLDAVGLRDGKLHGAAVRFYPGTEQVMGEALYWQGERDGLREFWHPNGRLAGRSWWSRGELHGPTQSFYENGQLHHSSALWRGMTDGPTREYFESGKPAAFSFHIDDQEQGYQIDYWPNGKVRSFAVFCLGRPEDVMMEFYESGQLWYWTPFTDGVKHGEAVGFTEDGELERHQFFDHGKEVAALPSGAPKFPGVDNVEIPPEALALR